MSESTRKENHLKGQSSPYLLQHLYNPVDWFPWGEQALQKARNENKPLLISIGYSACHWCHVMEHESFEDNRVAEIMNNNFVCIKVDREERPDIDHLYMNAVQLISGQGGWPLNCFALPDGRPFWGATYFPKEQWISILLRIDELYKTDYKGLENQADELTNGITGMSLLPPGSRQQDFPAETIHKMAGALCNKIDMQNGGMQGAPKFPLPILFEFLLHYHSKYADDILAFKSVNITLQKMAMGGIYDQAGGGFSRYSVDELWKVPHFEKMLYDNAQLISLYSKAWKTNPLPLYKCVVEETINFVERELQSSFGTFYSALDADSEGVEGKYYVWTREEIKYILGDDAPLAIEYFNIDRKGLWEHGHNILLIDTPAEEFAKEHNINPTEFISRVEQWKNILYSEREKRVRPGLDTKVIISWNAMMIEALAIAGSSFKKPVWIKSAETAAGFILRFAMQKNGKLYHTLNENKPAIDGFLEDYAALIKSLITLGQVTLKEHYFKTAHDLMQYTLDNFNSTETHMFSFSAVNGEKLVASYYDFQDGVIPSANSIMALNLFYLGNIFENNNWVERSRLMLADMQPHLEKYGRWATGWGILWLHHQGEFYTMAICGSQAAEKADEIFAKYLPDVLVCASTTGNSAIPVLQNRCKKDETLIYPCTLNMCLQPGTEVEEVLAVMN